MSNRMILSFALLSGICLGILLPAHGQAQQWTVAMRAMQNPLTLGQCTAIEVVVRDASGGTPVRPDGKQVDWQDFDLSITTTAPDAFAWSNEAHRFLCARAQTSTSALVVAYYPAKHLSPAELVPGISAQQTIEVALQGGAQPAAAPTPGQPYIPPAVAAVPPATPAGGVVVYTPSNPSIPASPTAAPAQAAGGGVSQPQQQVVYPNQATQPGAVAGASGQQPQQITYVNGGAPAAVAVAAPAPVAVEPKKESGGFFKKLGQHLKDKASEVKNQTTENLTNSATQVVDATAQTGSNLVSGATAQASAVAQTKVGSVSTSLVPSALRSGGNSDNLELAVKSGQAVLRMIHFGDNSAMLDASSIMFIGRLAKALNANPNPGGYGIIAFVDPLPAGIDPQKLSEDRAAAVKSLLEKDVEKTITLKAYGYGDSHPSPEVPPWGGPPTSARIEIWKLQ